MNMRFEDKNVLPMDRANTTYITPAKQKWNGTALEVDPKFLQYERSIATFINLKSTYNGQYTHKISYPPGKPKSPIILKLEYSIATRDLRVLLGQVKEGKMIGQIAFEAAIPRPTS